MSRPRRYFGTSFTEAEVDRLQEILGLHLKSEAVTVAMIIHAHVWQCDRQNAARVKTPDIKFAKRRLERIATAAAQLASLLDNEPLAEVLVRPSIPIWERSEAMIDGSLCMSTLRKIDRANVASLISIARDIRRNAELILADEDDLRAGLGLPQRKDVGKSAVSAWLWPNLFQIWNWSGKRVAKTNGGPLHRFIISVHEVYGLGEVKASTLKDSIADWQQDGWWQNQQPDPPWRAPDEN